MGLAVLVAALLGAFALPFYARAGHFGWVFVALCVYVLLAFALVQLVLWPLAVFESSQPLSEVARDALRAIVRRPAATLGLGVALLLINDARRATRTDARGTLQLLEDQDRSLWDAAAIAEGGNLIVDALRCGRPGRFALQAAIAAVHAEAPSYAATDWAQLLMLYDRLLREWTSPVVALNRAVVISMIDGPEAALVEIARLELDGRLDGYRYLPATKADLLRRLGRRDEAIRSYQEALALTENAAERAFLEGRVAEMSALDRVPGAE